MTSGSNLNAVASVDREKRESPLSDTVSITTIERPVLDLVRDNLLRRTRRNWKVEGGIGITCRPMTSRVNPAHPTFRGGRKAEPGGDGHHQTPPGFGQRPVGQGPAAAVHRQLGAESRSGYSVLQPFPQSQWRILVGALDAGCAPKQFKDSDVNPESEYRYKMIAQGKDGLLSDPVESEPILSPIIKPKN